MNLVNKTSFILFFDVKVQFSFKWCLHFCLNKGQSMLKQKFYIMEDKLLLNIHVLVCTNHLLNYNIFTRKKKPDICKRGFQYCVLKSPEWTYFLRLGTRTVEILLFGFKTFGWGTDQLSETRKLRFCSKIYIILFIILRNEFKLRPCS